jgi:phosphopantetheinyl transferase (holo-ACP synthase)
MVSRELYNQPEVVGQENIDSDSNIKKDKTGSILDYAVSNFDPNRGFSFTQSLGEDFGESQYDDTSIELFQEQVDNLNQWRAEEQPWYDAFGNALVSRATSIIPKTLSSVAMGASFLGGTIPDLISDAISKDKDVDFARSLEKTYNNPVSEAMQAWDDSLKESLPVYGGDDYYQTESLADKIGTAKFWTEDLFDGIAFSASAMATGAGVGSALKAVGMAGKALQYGSIGLTTAVNTINEAGLEASQVAKSIEASRNDYIMTNATKDPRYKEILKLEEEASKYPPSFAKEESGVIIDGPKEKLLKLASQLKDDMLREYNEKFDFEKGESAKNVFLANSAVLVLPNTIQSVLFNRFLKNGTKSVAKKIMDGELDPKSINVWKGTLKDMGLSYVSESSEEGAQNAIAKYEEERLFRTNGDDSRLGSYVNQFVKNIFMQDPEGSSEALLGGITGLLMGGMAAHGTRRREAAEASVLASKWETLSKYMRNSNLAMMDVDSSLLKEFGEQDELDEEGNPTGKKIKVYTDENGKTHYDLDKIMKVLEYKTRDKSAIEALAFAATEDTDLSEPLAEAVTTAKLGDLFWGAMQKVDGTFYTNEQEALDGVKSDLDAMLKNQPDETTQERVDQLKASLDTMMEQYTKAKSIISDNTDSSLLTDNSNSGYLYYLEKALFYAMQQEQVFSRGMERAKSDEERARYSGLKDESTNLIAELSTKEGVTKAVDAIKQDLNKVDALKLELNKESAKPAMTKEEQDKLLALDKEYADKIEEVKLDESKSDEEKAESLKSINDDLNAKKEEISNKYKNDQRLSDIRYEIEETIAIHGTSKDALMYGLDFIKTGLSVDDIINGVKLGFRDKWIYNIGKSRVMTSSLYEKMSNIGNDINSDEGLNNAFDVLNYGLENAEIIAWDDKFDYPRKSIVQKAKDYVLNRSNEIERELSDINESVANEQDPSMIQMGLQRISQLRAQLNDYSSMYMDIEKAASLLDTAIANREQKFEELNKEAKSFDVFLKVQFAKEYIDELNKYIARINSEIETYSDKQALDREIKKAKSRLSVYRNRYSSLMPEFDAIADDLEKQIELLNALYQQVSLNSANKSALDSTLASEDAVSKLESLGLSLKGDKLVVEDAELFDEFKKLLPEKEANNLLSILSGTDDRPMASVFYDKIIQLAKENENVESFISTQIDKRIKELQNEVPDELDGSLIYRSMGTSAVPEELRVFSSFIQYIIGYNPSRGAVDLYTTFLRTANRPGNIPEEKSTALEKYMATLDINRLLLDLQAEVASGIYTILNDAELTNAFIKSIYLIKKAQQLTNLSNDLRSDFNRAKTVDAEESLLSDAKKNNPSLVIAPTKQQRIAIHSVIKWFLRPSKDEKSLKNKNRPDGLDGAMFVQGIAGTGKTKIVVKWTLNLLSKLGYLKDNEVIAFSNTESNTIDLNATVFPGRKIETPKASLNISKEDIPNTVKLLVVDEAAFLSKDELNSIASVIDEVNKSRKSTGLKPVKLLMLGDPNQISKTASFDSLGSPLNSYFALNGNGLGIENSPTLIVPYRSDVVEISETADAFQGKKRKLGYSVDTKCTANLFDANAVNPLGVHNVSSITSFVDQINTLLNNKSVAKATIVYNTQDELNSLTRAFADVDPSRYEFVFYKDMQGRTIDSIFVYITPNGFASYQKKQDSEFNTAMYTMISRATKYALIYNAQRPDGSYPFGDNKFISSITSTAEESKKSIKNNYNVYSDDLIFEKQVLSGTSTKKATRTKEEKAEEKLVNNTEEEAELDEAREEVEEAQADLNEDFEDVLDDGSLIPEEDLSDEEQSDESIVGVNIEGNVVSFKMEHPTSSSIIDSVDSPVKKGAELVFLRVNKNGKMMIGVYAKKQNGDLVNVGMLSQAEVAMLNLADEVTGDKNSITIEKVKNIDKISKSAFIKLNGENISGKIVSSPKKLKFVYSENSFDENTDGNMISRVLQKVSNAFGVEFNSNSIVGFKIFSNKDLEDEALKTKKLYSGSHVYMILNIPNSKKQIYVALSAKKMSNTGLAKIGKNGRDLNVKSIISDLANSFKSISTYFMNEDFKLGNLKFNNFIHQFSKLLNESNGFSLPDGVISFEHFDSYGQTLLKEIFNDSVDELNGFYNLHKKELATILSSLYDESMVSTKADLSIDEEVNKYGFAESIAVYNGQFNSALSNIFDLISDKYDAEEAYNAYSNAKDLPSLSRQSFLGIYNLLATAKDKEAMYLQLIDIFTGKSFLSGKIFSKGASVVIAEELGLSKSKDDVQLVRCVRDLTKSILDKSPIQTMPGSPVNGILYKYSYGNEGSGVGSIYYMNSDDENQLADFKKLESKRISKKNSSNAQTSFDYLVRSNKSMEGYRRQANETEREKRNFLFYGEPILPTEVKYGLKFKRFLSELAGIKEDQLPNFSSDRDKVEQSLINSGFSIDQAAAVLDEYETNGLKTVTTDVLESSIDDNNNIPLDRNYYNSMSKNMNDSKGVLNDEEMSDFIKEISSNLMTNLSEVNPTEISISVESGSSIKKETNALAVQEKTISIEEDLNDDFIEASLFDDLSGNVAEAEKAFMSEENGLSLQENLFNQSEINNAEDRKKKC